MKGMMIFFDRKEAYEQWNPVVQSKEYNYIFTILVDRSNRIVEFEIAAYQEDSGAITYRKVMAVSESTTFTAAKQENGPRRCWSILFSICRSPKWSMSAMGPIRWCVRSGKRSVRLSDFFQKYVEYFS